MRQHRCALPPTGTATGNEIDIHFVNYNRDESHDPPKRGVEDERPIAVPQVKCDVVIPAGSRIAKVEFITPEEPEPKLLALEMANNRARFATPQFLVYGIARIHLQGGTAQSSGTAAASHRVKHDTAMLHATIREQFSKDSVRSAPFEPFDHAECSRSF